jgi:voltage-gated potassium channel
MASAARTGAVPTDATREVQLERLFDVPLFVAALLVIPLIVLDEAHVSHGWKVLGGVLNWVVWSAFAIEALTMLKVSADRMKWVRGHPLEIAIVVLTPPFLPASLAALRLFRLLRVLRVAVVIREYRKLFTFDGVRGAAVVAAVAALGGGALFSDVEKGYSMWDGVWWAVVTMTTVGYGDLSPRTVTGRGVGIVLMMIGIGFVALLTGAIAERFVSVGVHTEAVEAEAQVASEIGDVRTALLRVLREIGGRLRELERAVERLDEC